MEIDNNTYQTATNSPGIAGKISDANEISEYAQAQIDEQQSLEDYKELLKLTLISLGNRYKAHEHWTRWMAKLIYCIKI